MFSKHIIRSVVLAGLLGLSACGYQPLYATRDDGSSVSQKLAEVSVVQQSTRVGQLIRNEIVRSTRPVGTQAQDRYYLKLDAKGDAQTLINTSDTVHRRLASNLSYGTRLNAFPENRTFCVAASTSWNLVVRL